jgi:hypothetical protein
MRRFTFVLMLAVIASVVAMAFTVATASAVNLPPCCF